MEIVAIDKEVLDAMFERMAYLHNMLHTLFERVRDKNPDDWLSLEETCRLLNISERKVRNLQSGGRIGFVRCGKKYKSCTPELWNPRESRLNGKSREAVETNAKIEKLLLAINTAFDSLVGRKVDFDATDVKDLFQGSMETQMTLMKMTDVVCYDLKARIGIDRAKGTYPGYHYMRLTLGEFIEHQYKVKDLAFGQLTEQFIHDYQAFAMENKGYAIDTVRHHLAILKKICRLAYKKGYADRSHFQHFTLPKKTETTPRALSR